MGFVEDGSDNEFYYMVYNKSRTIANEASIINDEGNPVPNVCPECGSKIGIFLKGEPVYLCTNKKCHKYFGTVKCKNDKASESEIPDAIFESGLSLDKLENYIIIN